MKREALGALGESVAAQYLEAKGFLIRECNYRVLEGEIDIIAEEVGTLVFVEVKTRRSNKFGLPEEAITRKKRARLIKAALNYLEERQYHDVNWRFDLIAIECHPKGEVSRIEHVEDIIQAESGEFF